MHFRGVIVLNLQFRWGKGPVGPGQGELKGVNSFLLVSGKGISLVKISYIM